MTDLSDSAEAAEAAATARAIEAMDAAVRDGAYGLRWWAAAVMILAALMNPIDTTIVNVALPTIQRDLGAGSTSLEWVVSAYLLAFAASLITAGRIGDLVGRRRVFLVGVAGFGAASLMCGAAQTPTELILGRVVQGIAAATLLPQVLATFREMFAGKERGVAFGVYGATAGFASAIGLLLGGVLTDANLLGLGWRTIFLVNVPIAVIAFSAGLVTVPETRAVRASRPNLVGTVILVLALIAIVYPLLEGRRLGWPPWCWAMLAAGPLAIALLAFVDTRRAASGVAPLVPTALFRIRAFLAGVVLYAVLGAALLGFFLIFTLWIQGGEGYSATRAGDDHRCLQPRSRDDRRGVRPARHQVRPPRARHRRRDAGGGLRDDPGRRRARPRTDQLVVARARPGDRGRGPGAPDRAAHQRGPVRRPP